MQNSTLLIKNSSESRFSMVHMPMPDEVNCHGDIYGGHIMRHVDLAGAICACRHARMRVVTASVRRMDFVAPAKPGMILTFYASVNKVMRTSMEVGICIEAEEPISGKITHIGTCYLIFVGIDSQGKPSLLPQILHESEEDKRRMSDATRRMAFTRLEKKFSSTKEEYSPFSLLHGRFVHHTIDQDALIPFLSSLPKDAFLHITKDKQGVSILVEEEYAHSFIHKEKSCSYFSGIQFNTSKHESDNTLLSLAVYLLEAESIPVLSFSTATGEYLFVPHMHMAKSKETLCNAGYLMNS